MTKMIKRLLTQIEDILNQLSSLFNNKRQNDMSMAGNGSIVNDANIPPNTEVLKSGSSDSNENTQKNRKAITADEIDSVIDNFLKETDRKYFPDKELDEFNKMEVMERLECYKELSKKLQEIVIDLAKSDTSEDLNYLRKIFIRLTESEQANSEWYWYPIQILMYASGISSLSVEDYKVLHVVLNTEIKEPPNSRRQIPIIIRRWNKTALEYMRLADFGVHSRSKHLYNFLRQNEVFCSAIRYEGKNYDQLFYRFEMFFSLAFYYELQKDSKFNQESKIHVAKGLSILDASAYALLIKEAEEKQEAWEPIQAGLFDGSIDNFLECANNFQKEILVK